MELVAAFVVLVLLMFWASFVVQRANPKTNVEKILWYLVIFCMPFIGALLVFVRFKRTPVERSLETKMQPALVEAHAKKHRDAQDSGAEA